MKGPTHMYHPEFGVREFTSQDELDEAQENDDNAWRDTPYSDEEKADLGIDEPETEDEQPAGAPKLPKAKVKARTKAKK